MIYTHNLKHSLILSLCLEITAYFLHRLYSLVKIFQPWLLTYWSFLCVYGSTLYSLSHRYSYSLPLVHNSSWKTFHNRYSSGTIHRISLHKRSEKIFSSFQESNAWNDLWSISSQPIIITFCDQRAKSGMGLEIDIFLLCYLFSPIKMILFLFIPDSWCYSFHKGDRRRNSLESLFWIYLNASVKWECFFGGQKNNHSQILRTIKTGHVFWNILLLSGHPAHFCG